MSSMENNKVKQYDRSTDTRYLARICNVARIYADLHSSCMDFCKNKVYLAENTSNYNWDYHDIAMCMHSIWSIY